MAMNQLPFLQHIWSLITSQFRTPYNEFVSRNLKGADYEADNTLAPNKIIIAANNDYCAGLLLPDDQSCALGIWTLDGLDAAGCGVEPDGVLLVQVLQPTFLVDPNQSPFGHARVCEAYSQELTWPIASLANVAMYEDVFEICCPTCLLASSTACDACLWAIPVWSNGVDASANPKLITKVGSPILVCTPA